MHKIEVLAFAEPGVDRPARERWAVAGTPHFLMLPKIVQGVTFTNGVEVINTPAQSAA